jgi:hypothetical protein
MDLDRYDSLKEMLQEHSGNQPEAQTEILENLKKTWLCKQCNVGYLEIIIFNKINCTWYYRACSNCTHRTKSQKYSPSVQGIIKKAADGN